MKIEKFIDSLNADFFVGVPDSQLKVMCDYLINNYGIDGKHHIIAANEGNCVGVATGYYLATRKIPVVYMQNSGQGNALNPIASLANRNVYGIPIIFVIGWRGEPSVHDEPQHIFQGQITLSLLDLLDIHYMIVDKDTSDEELKDFINKQKGQMECGIQIAIVVKKEAFEGDKPTTYKNDYSITRESAIEHVVKIAKDSPIITTTGKASRELFEIRERMGQSHDRDFMTVGSMGHSSSIALGIAINLVDKKVWCIDGDGALLMHLGAMATIGSMAPDNMIHVVINNQAHESVGGMPTVANDISFGQIATGCGYKNIYRVSKEEEIDEILVEAEAKKGLTFIEINCAIGARKDLGRPTTTPIENKEKFMEYISNSRR